VNKILNQSQLCFNTLISNLTTVYNNANTFNTNNSYITNKFNLQQSMANTIQPLLNTHQALDSWLDSWLSLMQT